MNKKNVCKFITGSNTGQIRTTRFIFEQELPHDGVEQIMPDNMMYLVSGGEGFVRSGGVHWRVTTGSIFFSFSAVPFTIENKKDLKYYYISFGGNRAEELFRRFGLTPANFVLDGYEGLIPLWSDSITRANSDNIDLLCESILLYSFSRLKPSVQGGGDTVSFVLNYLEDNFTDCRLSLNEVAAAAGYNPKYLSHLFKKQFGMGFSEYLRILRIKHAVNLIENGVTSVKNVALLSGFSDPLYFSKVFSESVGVSPSNYRKKNK